MAGGFADMDKRNALEHTFLRTVMCDWVKVGPPLGRIGAI